MNYIKTSTKFLILSMTILFSCQDYEFQDLTNTRYPLTVKNVEIEGELMETDRMLANSHYEFNITFDSDIKGKYYFKIEGGDTQIVKTGQTYNAKTEYVPITTELDHNFHMNSEKFIILFPNTSEYVDYTLSLYFHQRHQPMTPEWLTPVTDDYGKFSAAVTSASFTVQPIALQSQSSKLLGTQNLIFTRIISTKDKLKDLSFKVTKSGESIEYNGLVQYDINADNTISMSQLESSAGIAFKAINTETFNNSAFRTSSLSENNSALSPSEIYIDGLFSDNGKTDTEIDSLVQDTARKDVFYVADIAITYSAIKTGKSDVTLTATSLGVESAFKDVVTVIDAQFVANYTFETTFLPNVINPVSYIVSSLNKDLEDNTFEMFFTSDDPNLRLHRTISNEEIIYNGEEPFEFDSSYWNGNFGIKTTSTGPHTLTFHLRETVSGTIVSSNEYRINSNFEMQFTANYTFETNFLPNRINPVTYVVTSLNEELGDNAFEMYFTSDDPNLKLHRTIGEDETIYSGEEPFEFDSSYWNGNFGIKTTSTGAYTLTFHLRETVSGSILSSKEYTINSNFENIFTANYTFETTFLPNVINTVNYVITSLSEDFGDNVFEMYFTSDDPNLRLHRTVGEDETIYIGDQKFEFDSSYLNGNFGIKTTSTGTYILTFHLKEMISGTILSSKEYTINSNAAMFAMETPNFPTSTFVNNENTFAYTINDITENLANSLLINNQTTGFEMTFISDDDTFRLIDGAGVEYSSTSTFEIASDSDNFGLLGKLASGNIKFKSSNTGTSLVTFTLTENESRTAYAISKEFLINNTTLNEDTVSISLFSNDVSIGVTETRGYLSNSIVINDDNLLNTYDIKISKTAITNGNTNVWNFVGNDESLDIIDYDTYPAHSTLNDITNGTHTFYYIGNDNFNTLYYYNNLIGTYNITFTLLRDDGAELAITKTLEIIDDRINFSLVGIADRTVDITTASNSLNQFSESSFFDFNYIAPTTTNGLTVSYQCLTNGIESTALGVFVNNTALVLGRSYPASLTTPIIVAKEVGNHILRVTLTSGNGGTKFLDVPITVNSVDLNSLLTFSNLSSIDSRGMDRGSDVEVGENARFRMALNISPSKISSKIVNSLNPRLLFDKYTTNTITNQSSLFANNIELIGANSIRQGTYRFSNVNDSQNFVISDINTTGSLNYKCKLVLGGVVPSNPTVTISRSVTGYSITFGLIGIEDQRVDITTASNSLNQFSEKSFFDFDYSSSTAHHGLRVSYQCFTNGIESTALGVFVANIEHVLGRSYSARVSRPIIVAKKAGNHILRVRLTRTVSITGGTFLDVPITVNSVDLNNFLTFTPLATIDAAGVTRNIVNSRVTYTTPNVTAHTRQDPRFRLSLNVSPNTISPKIVTSLTPRITFNKGLGSILINQSSLSTLSSSSIIAPNNRAEGVFNFTVANSSQDFILSNINTTGNLSYTYQLSLGNLVTRSNSLYYHIRAYVPRTIYFYTPSGETNLSLDPWVVTTLAGSESCSYTSSYWRCSTRHSTNNNEDDDYFYTYHNRTAISNPGNCAFVRNVTVNTTITGKLQRVRSRTSTGYLLRNNNDDATFVRGNLSFQRTETQTQVIYSNCTYGWSGNSTFTPIRATGQYTDNWGYIYNNHSGLDWNNQPRTSW